MGDYDFKSLSSYDFALLARDLLQVDLGVRLESFSQAPDSGIDYRYQKRRTKVIVQCKHYAESGFSALTSVLRRKGRAKIDTIKPTRYILATSVSLTPDRKKEIRSILGERGSTFSDIVGREDLNNILSQNPDIERRHFKLWLTSEPVLQRVMHAGIIGDSEAHLDRVRLRLSRYVQNPSFDRARALLDKHHYCIIAGIPGIGKTTLAEVLLADLVDRQGFEAFRISHDLSEIGPIKNSKRKQVFYFDDFLGKTTLEKLRKNEDQRLVELMEEVAANRNWRFILTTREYILNGARLAYEAFAQPSIDFMLCVINLADYTRPIRGRILYNHLYFSDLPREHKLAILQNDGYENILGHRNYSPRVIEYMTQARFACTVAPSLYLPEFITNLDNPARIWDHAFRHQISEASRHLLLVLSTLPDTVLLGDCEIAVWAFYGFRQKRFGFNTGSLDWEDGLKQLDGNFVKTQKIGKDSVISFHSPSIRDFIESFLATSDSDVADLINGAHFYEQFTSLWNGRHGKRYEGVDVHRKEFLDILRRNLFGPSADVVRIVDEAGEPHGMSRQPASYESRAGFVVALANDWKSEAGDRLLAGVVAELGKLWGEGKANRLDLVKLLDALGKRGLKQADDLFAQAAKCLSNNLQVMDDFLAVAEFVNKYPSLVARSNVEAIRARFAEFASDYSDQWADSDDDPDWLRDIAGNLELAGEGLAIDVSKFTAPLREQADQIEIERAEDRPNEDSSDDDWRPASYEDDVAMMFRSLREDIGD